MLKHGFAVLLAISLFLCCSGLLYAQTAASSAIRGRFALSVLVRTAFTEVA